jgi:hypothetical protein
VCDDGDPCTTDTCVNGVCVFTPIVCDDGDPCTVDTCVNGVCVHTPMDCDDNDPCTLDTCVNGTCVFTPVNPCPSLVLVPDSDCYQTGDIVTVHLNMLNMTDVVVGGQFFLNYDDLALTLIEATPGDPTGTNPANPFELEIYECHGQTIAGICQVTAGLLEYAVGVIPPNPGTSADSTLAILRFVANTEICDTAGLVQFRENVGAPPAPPTQLGQADGDAVVLDDLFDLPAISIDDTDPFITCPPDLVVHPPAGTCAPTMVVTGAATATDNCTADEDIVIVGVRDDSEPLNAPYPEGDTVITWTATDCSGNSVACDQTITVSDSNEMDVVVQLSPNVNTGGMYPQTLSRCITFEFWSCPSLMPAETVEVVMEFEIPGPGVAIATDTILVPCGDYDCVTARDKRHTLRRTANALNIVGTKYQAAFTGATPSGDWLIGGNLNDDNVIDILDFGVFVGEYLEDYGTGDTHCLTPMPHADVSGDGLVFLEDYTFISNNFLNFHDPNCCGAPALAGAMALNGAGQFGVSRGITRISVAELRKRGMDDLIVADLNGDGWLDPADIQAFLTSGVPGK